MEFLDFCANILRWESAIICGLINISILCNHFLSKKWVFLILIFNLSLVHFISYRFYFFAVIFWKFFFQKMYFSTLYFKDLSCKFYLTRAQSNSIKKKVRDDNRWWRAMSFEKVCKRVASGLAASWKIAIRVINAWRENNETPGGWYYSAINKCCI